MRAAEVTRRLRASFVRPPLLRSFNTSAGVCVVVGTYDKDRVENAIGVQGWKIELTEKILGSTYFYLKSP